MEGRRLATFQKTRNENKQTVKCATCQTLEKQKKLTNQRSMVYLELFFKTTKNGTYVICHTSGNSKEKNKILYICRKSEKTNKTQKLENKRFTTFHKTKQKRQRKMRYLSLHNNKKRKSKATYISRKRKNPAGIPERLGGICERTLRISLQNHSFF